MFPMAQEQSYAGGVGCVRQVSSYQFHQSESLLLPLSPSPEDDRETRLFPRHSSWVTVAQRGYFSRTYPRNDNLIKRGSKREKEGEGEHRKDLGSLLLTAVPLQEGSYQRKTDKNRNLALSVSVYCLKEGTRLPTPSAILVPST